MNYSYVQGLYCGIVLCTVMIQSDNTNTKECTAMYIFVYSQPDSVHIASIIEQIKTQTSHCG